MTTTTSLLGATSGALDPEERIVSSARGSGGGLGLANQERESPRPEKPVRDPLDPDTWGTLGKIGLAMEAFGSGYRGQTSMAERLSEKREQRAAMNMHRVEMFQKNLNAVNTMQKAIESLPAGSEAREQAVNTFRQQMPPELQDLFDAVVQDPRLLPENAVELLKDTETGRLRFLAGDKITEIAKDPQVQEEVRRNQDLRNIQVIPGKIEKSLDWLRLNDPKTWMKVRDGVDSIDEVIELNRKLPTNFQHRMTEKEMMTLLTNDEFAASIGIMSAEGRQRILEEKAKRSEIPADRVTPKSFVREDGRRGVLVTQDSVLLDGDDKPTPLTGSEIFVSSQEVGKPGSFHKPSSKVIQDIDQAEVSTRASFRIFKRLTGLIRDNPTRLAVAGSVSRGFEELRATVKGVGQSLGWTYEIDGKSVDADTYINSMTGQSSEEIDKITSIFNPRNAEESARIKSAVTSLGYAIAFSNNPDGRISEPDFRNAVKQLGESASPRMFETVLMDVASDLAARFEDTVRVANRTYGLDREIPDLMGEFFPEREEFGDFGPATVRPQDVENMSEAEFNMLLDQEFDENDPNSAALERAMHRRLSRGR